MLAYQIITSIVLFPVLDIQLCEEIMVEHEVACENACTQLQSGVSCEQNCEQIANPMMGLRDQPRCEFKNATNTCDVNPLMGNAATCEAGAYIFQLVTISIPFILWQTYFLYLLNAYIVRYETNTGRTMMDSNAQATQVTTSNPARETSES